MIRKTQVEVFRDGKWVPVTFVPDYKRIVMALLALAFFGAMIYVGIEKLRRPSVAEVLTAVETETETDNEVVGAAELNGERFVFDRKGTAYKESQGKLEARNKIPFALGANETLGSVMENKYGLIFAVNNKEESLSKLMLWDGSIAKEDKVFFGTEVLPNKEKEGPLLLTKQGRFLYKDDEGSWKQIKVPTDVSQISDYILGGKNFYVLGIDETLWATSIDNIDAPDNRWQKLIAGDEKDSLFDENSDIETLPLILAAFEGKVVILNNQGGVEDWSVTKDEILMKDYWNLGEILKKKPTILGSYLLKKIDILDGATWCYLSAKSAKCLNRNHNYQVYKLTAENLLIVNKSDFLIETLVSR